MKFRTKLAVGLIASVFALGAAGAAENCPDMHCDGADMTQSKAQMTAVATANKRLSALKDQLKITQQQEPAWQTFADQVNDQAKATAALHEKMLKELKAPTLTTPDRMALMADIMKLRAQHMARMAGVAKIFYNQLSPEQQGVFEKMHRDYMNVKHTAK